MVTKEESFHASFFELVPALKEKNVFNNKETLNCYIKKFSSVQVACKSCSVKQFLFKLLFPDCKGLITWAS